MASDGKVNFQEFFESVSRVYAGCTKEQFSTVFRETDTDLDGLLNAAEMRDAMAKLAQQSFQNWAKCQLESSADVKVHSLHVNSLIQSRFATTVVESRVSNQRHSATQAEFAVNLPDAAFITKFSMVIDGKTVDGDVKEKAEAKETYDIAKSAGRSAGHIAQRPRETNCFQISVNVAAFSEVFFKLTYQEVLERVHGCYKHVVNVQPGQVVEDVEVRVRVEEARRISAVHVPAFGARVGERANGALLGLPRDSDVRVDERLSDAFSTVDVLYRPTVERQGQLARHADTGIAGQLVLLYDVERSPADAGQIQVVNGYFVHFFAPAGLPPTKKHIVFVVDVSGSMQGAKIEQTKDALRVIIGDLNDGDYFNMVTFSDSVSLWQSASKRVNPSNCADATRFVNGLRASGSTDIDRAFKQTLQLFDKNDGMSFHPIIIFLTDGQPTCGERRSDKICSQLQTYNRKRFATIHSLAFGRDADFALLMCISDAHRGLAKKLYEDSDASLQLQGFYAHICSPLLTDVRFHYLDDLVDPDSIVQDRHGIYYSGAESVVFGRLKLHLSLATERLCVQVAGMGLNGGQQFTANCHIPKQQADVPPVETVGGFVERMWAYKTVKKLLDRSKYIETDSSVASRTRRDALALCLKYQFVTELTSMVVVQPEVVADKECQVVRDDDPWSSLHRSKRRLLGEKLSRSARSPPQMMAATASLSPPGRGSSSGRGFLAGGGTPRQAVSWRRADAASAAASPKAQQQERGFKAAKQSFGSGSLSERVRDKDASDLRFSSSESTDSLSEHDNRGVNRNEKMDECDEAMSISLPSLPPPPPQTLGQVLRDRPLCHPRSGTGDEPAALVDAADPLLQHALRSSATSVWAPAPAAHGTLAAIGQPPTGISETYDAPPPHSVQLGALRLNIFLAGDYAVRGVGAALCIQLDAWHAVDPRLPGAQGYRTLLPLSERRRLFDLHELIVGSLTGAEHVVVLASQTDFSALSLARRHADFDLYKQTFFYHLDQLFVKIKGTGSKAVIMLMGPFEQSELNGDDVAEWDRLTRGVCEKQSVTYVSLKSAAAVTPSELSPLGAADQLAVGKHVARAILALLQRR